MARLTDQVEKNTAPGPDYLVHVVDPADTTNNPAGSSFKMKVSNLVGTFVASLGLYFNKSVDDTDDITEGATKKFTSAADIAKLAGIAPGATANASDAALRARSSHTGTQTASTISDFDTAADARIANHVAQADPHAQYQKESEKDAALGYAGLDAGGKINPSQLPAIAVTDTFVVASQAAQVALTAEVGDIAVRTDQNKSYILRVSPASSFANWQELLTPTDLVQSFNGRVGAVTPQAADYTATQVTNTPAGNIAATTVQAALNELDAEKVAGPASATDGTIPAYDGATGKLLKNTAATIAPDGTITTPDVTVPQGGTGFELFNTADQVTNFERGRLSWVANVLTLATKLGGTGAARNIDVVANDTNANVTVRTPANTFRVSDGGGANAFFEFVRNTNFTNTALLRLTTIFSHSSTTPSVLKITPTITQTATAGYTGIELDVTETTVGSGQKSLLDLKLNAVSQLRVDKFGNVTSLLGNFISATDFFLQANAASVYLRPTGQNQNNALRVSAGGTGTRLTMYDAAAANPLTISHDGAAGLVSSATISVPIEAYNATTWNGSGKVTTMDAIRDIVESLLAMIGAKINGVEAVSGTAGAMRIEDGVSGGGNVRIRRIVGAGATVVSIDGNNDIEVYTPPGGGSTTLTEIEVDMGNKSNSKRFTITAAGVTPSSKILVFPSPNVATGRKGNDWESDTATMTGLAGTGDFQLSIVSPYFMRGKRKVYYQVV